jgi:hypothetical protein
MPTRLKEAEKRKKEEEAMVQATLEREKEAAARQLQEEAAKATAAAGMMQLMVVSPPSTSNLNSLLTGHVGQDTNGTKEEGTALNAKDDKVSGDNGKPPKQKKTRKSKSNKKGKDDVATKKKRRSSALKQGSIAVTFPMPRPPAPAYKYKQVFYKAGMELKGEDKYCAYIKQTGNLLKNIQLVDPSAILHAAVKTEATKPIGKKEELSNNMTIFLAYAPVGKNQNAFKPKKNNNKKKGRCGKDEPELLDPRVYPTLVFLSNMDLETIMSRVTHEFCCAGGFYSRKKQLQCVETVTPLIIFYLFTFNDIATLRAELTDLLKKAHEELESDFMLPEEFQYSTTPEINIRRGVPKLLGQPGSQFRDYSREMQEAQRAHLIECDVQAIPFLMLLINHVKDRRLTALVWGGHAHIMGTVDWDSPKGNLSQFVQMSQDHMCYNMSVVSAEVQGIMDLDASAEVICPQSGKTLGRISLRETLMKYLKLKDGTPLVAESHQRRPQGPVDMVIPNSGKAEAHLEMFNKQPAGYLYYMLPTFGATETFTKSLLRRSMDAGLATEAPKCKYNAATQILTTPRDAQQESVLSDVRSLPFSQDIDAIKRATGGGKKGKKEHTAPEMCFQLGSTRSIQMEHSNNNRNYTKVAEPGVELGLGNKASPAKKLNAEQPAIKIDSTDDAGSSNEESEEGSDDLSSSDETSASTSSDEEE